VVKVFVSWSGGKDSCLACHKALSQGYEVAYLLNMVIDDKKFPMGRHGISLELLRAQAQAMGFTLIQQHTVGNEYERQFKSIVNKLIQKGIGGGIFGDIGTVVNHLDWVKRVCDDLGIECMEPLWGQSQKQVLTDFIYAGFKAVVVATKSDVMGPEWLGRKVDSSFVRDVARIGIDPCGEAGEYHTFVINGPIFQRRIQILRSEKVLKEGHWFLNIAEHKLRGKPRIVPPTK